MVAISHAATALLVKRRFPEASLAGLLVAVELPGILWVLLNLAGIEDSGAHMPYSHSVASMLGMAAGAWLIIGKLFRRRVMAAAVFAAIVLHLAVDLVLHSHPVVVAPFYAPVAVGLGLYATPPLAIAAAMAYGLLCWVLFRGSKALLAVILLLSIAQLSFVPEALLQQPYWLSAIAAVQIAAAIVLVWYFSRGRAAELEHPNRRLARAFA